MPRWPHLRTLAAMPAIHFAILGGLLFVVSIGRESAADFEPDDRPRIEIPASRIAEAEETFRLERRRPPTPVEAAELIDALVDDEVLFRHALALGLHQAAIPQRRLAQIAAFVEPAGERSTAELARQAVDLGLHEGDFVSRRVLIDSARRLVRGAARLIEPSDRAIADYLRVQGERFRDEDRFRITHVLRSRARRSAPVDDAVELLDRLQRESMPPIDAVELADPGIVVPELPLLGARALDRRFGVGFSRRLAELPTGEWSGPIETRHGASVVFVHEHRPGQIPPPAEVGGPIRAVLREAAADRWLAARLRQLRADYEIVIDDPVDPGAETEVAS